MDKYTVEQLKQWHASTNFGKDTIPNSKLLGCFNCLKTYTPSSIKAYLDEGNYWNNDESVDTGILIS